MNKNDTFAQMDISIPSNAAVVCPEEMLLDKGASLAFGNTLVLPF